MPKAFYFIFITARFLFLARFVSLSLSTLSSHLTSPDAFLAFSYSTYHLPLLTASIILLQSHLTYSHLFTRTILFPSWFQTDLTIYIQCIYNVYIRPKLKGDLEMKGRKFVVLSDNLFDENGYRQTPEGRNCKVLKSGSEYFVKSITYHEGCNDIIYPVTRGEAYYLYNLQSNRQHLPFDYKQN